jgi:hypothetical protein
VAFEEAILKEKVLANHLQPFIKSRNRFGSMDWWKSKVGIVEEASQKCHLIALPDTARMIALDNYNRRGRCATIRKAYIKGTPKIHDSWEFVANLSNQNQS